MENLRRLNENEKKLLNALGMFPDMPVKELLNHVPYKTKSSIIRKIDQLKNRGIIRGPIYDVHFDKLCKNPLHKVFCMLESSHSYETLLSYITDIESIIWVFPVLSPHKNMLNVGFLSSDVTELTALFQLLKDSNILTDYIARAFSSERMVVPPNFFGDTDPPLDNVLNTCELPDISLECHDTVWNECDIAVLPYLQRGKKLIEILRSERKLNKTWTYDQIKYSREKMLKNRLIEKKYAIYPFEPEQCAHFVLFLKTEDTKLTQRILYNFAKGARIYKEYVLCSEWGMLFCVSYRQFLTKLLYELDKINEIKEKELYQVRSVPTKYRFWSRLPQIEYYSFDEQTLEYPYHAYRRKIEEALQGSSLDY